MNTRKAKATLILGCLAALAGPAAAQSEPSGHDHSAHRMMQRKATYERSVAGYAIPDLTLVDQDGRNVGLRSVLDSDRPVGLTFIFTTCSTICPVMTATFRNMQRELGDESEDLRLVAITIDPEFDSPAVMKAYSERYGFGPGWSFLTGEPKQIVTVLKSFEAYYGDKMNHRPLYLFKRPGESSWVRIEGLARGSDMVAEYRELIGDKGHASHH